jgi:hypothetical protein
LAIARARATWAAPLTAGQLADRLVARDTDLRQPAQRQRRVEAPVQLGAHEEQLVRREVPVQRRVLGHETDLGQDGNVVVRRPAEDPYGAGVRPQQTDRQVQQGALACPVGADQRGHPPGRQAQRAVPQRPGSAIPLPELVSFEHDVHP